MPYFKFAFNDGSRLIMDSVVLHLGDRSAAEARAETMVRDLMSVADGHDAAWADWRLEVRDEGDRVVTTVPFLSQMSRSGNKDVS